MTLGSETQDEPLSDLDYVRDKGKSRVSIPVVVSWHGMMVPVKGGEYGGWNGHPCCSKVWGTPSFKI